MDGLDSDICLLPDTQGMQRKPENWDIHRARYGLNSDIIVCLQFTPQEIPTNNGHPG